MRNFLITYPDDRKQMHTTGNVVNGYLVYPREIGVGEGVEKGAFNAYGEGETWIEYSSYKTVNYPVFSRDMLNEAGIDVDSLNKLTFKDVIDGVYDYLYGEGVLKSCLLRIGMNENGILIEDKKELEEKKWKELEEKIRNREAPIQFASKFGLGYVILQRIPDSIFHLINKFGYYENADDGTMEFLDDQGYYSVEPHQVRGWYFYEEAMKTLHENKFLVTINGKNYEEWSKK